MKKKLEKNDENNQLKIPQMENPELKPLDKKIDEKRKQKKNNP